MYITRLHVKNMKLMRNLELSFTHEGKPRMWTVFVAENGACKTTLLQTIALAASGPERANQLADVPSLPDLRRPAETARISADFVFGAQLEKWRRAPQHEALLVKGPVTTGVRSTLSIESAQSTFSGNSWSAPVEQLQSNSSEEVPPSMIALDRFVEALKSLSAGRPVKKASDLTVAQAVAGVLSYAVRARVVSEARSTSLPGWFVVGYGTQRQLPVPLSTSALTDRVLNRLEPLFGKASLVGTGFANQFADTPRFEPFINALKKVFVDNHLLPHVDAVELRGRGGMSQPGDLVRSHSFEFAFSGQKTKVPATWLSQGYQSTIAWIADLIGQMYLDIGEAVPLEDMEGMVLIDELDLHLHPTWQVRLVPMLKRIFPRMQFIVTTHSPMLLPALERHEIIMLRLDENGDVVAEAPPASPKLMTGSEIYSSFFNIQKLYPSDLGNDLRRYTFLSSDPTRTAEEDAEMLLLQKKLIDEGLDLGLPPVPRELS